MHDTYAALIVIASIILGFITSSRIAYFLFQRWGMFTDGEKLFNSIVCGALAGLLMLFGSIKIMEVSGLFGGLLFDVATVPYVGFCWVYLVGANKVFERILHTLVQRID